MKSGRLTLLLLTLIFLLSEIFFTYMVLAHGDGDWLSAIIKTLVFLVFILLYSKKLTWARWGLSVLLVLYGFIFFLIGIELTSIFFPFGAYNIFFGIYIHHAKALSVFRHDKIKNSEVIVNVMEDENSLQHINHQNLYPSLVRRYKALFIDGILIMITLVIIMMLTEDSPVRTYIMVSSALVLLLLYEPILTSYSKTVGQRLMKIKVGRYDQPEKRITLLNAYMRWFTKGLLGWASFITIHFNHERRAIHDLVSDSVMIKDDEIKKGNHHTTILKEPTL